MTRRYRPPVFTAATLLFIVVAFGTPDPATSAPAVNMAGEWIINDELTDELRRSLPEPKRRSGFFSGIRERVNITVGIPGTPVGVPVPGTGNDSADESEGAPLHSYGRVAAIEIRQGPDLFGVDYGKNRGFLYTPNETMQEEVDGRNVTTTSGWRGDRYVIRKSADDGSKMSEEFELINDGRQLKWTIVDHPKGRAEVTEVAVYDLADQAAEDGGADLKLAP